MPDESFSGLVRECYRALLWKEWRESWLLFLAVALLPTMGQIIALGMPPGRLLTRIVSLHVTPGSFLVLALTLGANIFAPERARGTQAFLMQHPLKPGVVWNAKMIMSLTALLLSYMLFAGALWLLPQRVPDHISWSMLAFGVGMGFPAFSAAALMSAFVERTVIAWAGGGTLWIALVFFSARLSKLVTSLVLIKPSYLAAIGIVLWVGVAFLLICLSRIIFLCSTRG